jgi:lipopolysaccharide/colanic/teichoic acid biosynthesis glycosyltransferase
LYSCGFELLDAQDFGSMHFYVCKKVGTPAYNLQATYGPLVRLKRVGKGGKLIKVYKLRTMYPYAEYLQEYINNTQGLQEGGKFKDDPRVTTLGRFFRKFWLDEMPMLVNMCRGEMKLVGGRPLSQHYLSLYPKDVQERRRNYKPGLLPPYYADMPKTLDEIVASEVRYMDAYDQKPWRTDLRYFVQILKNIFFKKARSK